LKKPVFTPPTRACQDAPVPKLRSRIAQAFKLPLGKGLFLQLVGKGG